MEECTDVSRGEGLCWNTNTEGLAPVLGDFRLLRQGPEAGVGPLCLGRLGSVTTGWSNQKIHRREDGLSKNGFSTWSWEGKVLRVESVGRC